MKTFREYVNEKEEAKYIREKLKKELGLSSRDVSVKTSNGGYSSSVRVSIKSMKALQKKKEIEEIGKEKENYDVDQRTGEILLGGNTYVFTELDYRFSQDIDEIIQKEFKKQLGDQNFDDNTPSVILFNTFSVDSSRGMVYVTLKGRGGQLAEIRDIRYIGAPLRHLIDKIGDSSLYSKIK